MLFLPDYNNAMRTINTLHGVLILLFVLFTYTTPSYAQQGSVYFSVGDNKAWYNNSTIHIVQDELGNSYDLYKAKGNDKTNSALSPLLLNYRLGYYFNEWQDLGLELNYDPVKYTIADGSVVSINGLVNNMINVHSTAKFSIKNGSYYYFDGLNLFLINLVKRWRVYRANTSDVSVDVLGKGGIGPVMPHFHSNLPVNPLDGPALTWGGWDYGFEAAVRVTLYRYVYVEVAAKYDYAMMDGLQIYDGTASQNLATREVIASIGFTLPTTRMNPLFRKERKIVTMLPWFQHMDELGANAPLKAVNNDTLGGPGVAEFSDIVDKNAAKFNLDSLASLDSAGQAEQAYKDSIVKATNKAKKRRRKHKEEVTDSVAEPATDTSVAAPKTIDTVKAPQPASPPPPDTPKQITAPEPAPEQPKPVELKEEEKKILKEAIEGVNFETSKDIIQKSSYPILDNVVKLMKNNPAYKLQINGHTDNKGSAQFNKTLSQKRSIAVKKYLVAHGVAGSRLKTAGYGGERPITTNDTEEGRLKNRRVEFIIE